MDNKPQMVIPSSFERMIIDGIIRTFFDGFSFTDQNGYTQTRPGPMQAIIGQISYKISEPIVKQIVSEINVEEIAKEIRAKIDMKAIEKEVKAEIRKKLMARLGK